MTTKTDKRRRIVLPGARPGEIYDVQKQGEGRFLLVRLDRPEPKAGMTREECLQAMSAAPLRLRMSWDELRVLTRV